MTNCDLLVRGGQVVSSHGVATADVIVENGTISAVGKAPSDLRAERTIDADGCLVLPGVVDVHNHPVYADDLESLTRAAAAGGITTVVPFIGAFPSWGFPKTSTHEVVDGFIEAWTGNVSCDFGIHGAFDSHDDVAEEVPKLVERGVTSFKFFMAYRKRGMMVEDQSLVSAMDTVGKAGGIAIVHAENGDGIEYLERNVWDTPSLPYDAFLASHTSLLETEAVLRSIALADAARCPLYVVHVAAGDAMKVVEIARRSARVPVWIETCPHYLVLTNDEVLRRGAISKIAPPLRSRSDNDALWDALESSEIQVVATDHGGFTIEMKAKGTNILQAPYGGEGVEHVLPIVYSSGVRNGRLSLERMVQVLSENPADIFGLPQKGRLSRGHDADIVVLDPEGTTRCMAESHVGASDYCLYEGMELKGAVRFVTRRGTVLVDEGSLTDEQHGGGYLRRLPFRARPVPTIDRVSGESPNLAVGPSPVQ